MRLLARRGNAEAAAAAGSDRKRRRGAPWTARRTLVGLAASWALLQRKQLQQWLVHIMRATLRSIQLAGATLDSVWWPYHEPTELHGPRLTARRFVGPPVDGAALPRRRRAFRLIPFAGVLLTGWPRRCRRCGGASGDLIPHDFLYLNPIVSLVYFAVKGL